MARIRTIKPDFFSSADICALKPLERLLYIAIWCEADREGRFDAAPSTLKLRYFPGDNCDIEKMIDALVTRGLLVFYASGTRQIGLVPSFKKHQFINNREVDSELPPPPDGIFDASGTRQARVTDAPCRKEGKERKGKDDASFVAFWSAYPRKDAKADAVRAWEKINPDESLANAIIAAVGKQAESADWRKDGGKYIPMPATYLNGRRWEDAGVSVSPAAPIPQWELDILREAGISN